MYNKNKMAKSNIRCNNAIPGETIEQKVKRMTQNKEPITDTGQLIYTDRKDGVNPDHDIRSDRWEYAIEAMDKASKSQIAKRENYIKERDTFNNKKEEPKADNNGDTKNPAA